MRMLGFGKNQIMSFCQIANNLAGLGNKSFYNFQSF